MMHLQRTAGNAAVSRLIASGARRPVLARFEAGEHARLGDPGRTIKVAGVPVTEGELIALGDFYASPKDLMEADPSELVRLRDLIRRDEDARMGFPGVKPVGDDEWEEAMKDRPPGKTYLDLAKDNAGHFAPGTDFGPPGRDHKSLFFEYHKQAIEKAQANATGSKTVPDEAVAINGFACHFLTDAFAAGHLFNKAAMLERAQDAWKQAADEEYGYDLENTFSRGVAHLVLSDPGAAAKLRPKEILVGDWGPVNRERFSFLLYQIPSRKPEEFFNVIVNIVHDRLNASVGTEQAIEVENTRGDRWTLAGDKSLAQSPDTERIATKAVAQSFHNLELAAKSPGWTLDNGQSVWDYTPKPTAAGAMNMKVLTDQALKLNEIATISAFAAKTIEHLDSGIEELEKLGYMRPAQPAQPAPPSQPVP